MIYYSSFFMDADTRRILLFRRHHNRLWQTAHTSYRPAPKTMDESRRELSTLFKAYFEVQEAVKPRTFEASLFSLTIAASRGLCTDFEYGDILPWDIDEALNLDLDARTRQAIKANVGLLMYFADVDHDVWCNMQDFAHGAQT